MEWLWKWLVVTGLIISSFFAADFALARGTEKTTPVAAAAVEKISSIHFKKEKIQIKSKVISVEVARTPEQHERGLMYRKSMGKDEGMLFVFENEQPLSFWMKNTYIDLSIAYFDKNKKIVDIQEMKATNELMVGEIPTYPSAKPSQYALEMNTQWFKKNKIKVGDSFIFKTGSK